MSNYMANSNLYLLKDSISVYKTQSVGYINQITKLIKLNIYKNISICPTFGIYSCIKH